MCGENTGQGLSVGQRRGVVGAGAVGAAIVAIADEFTRAGREGGTVV